MPRPTSLIAMKVAPPSFPCPLSQVCRVAKLHQMPANSTYDWSGVLEENARTVRTLRAVAAHRNMGAVGADVIEDLGQVWFDRRGGGTADDVHQFVQVGLDDGRPSRRPQFALLRRTPHEQVAINCGQYPIPLVLR